MRQGWRPGAVGETLSVEHLSKRFGQVVVALDVTFEIPGGGYCALLGPSGSGKTSLFNMVAGLVRPDAGRIRLGERVFDGPGQHLPAERRRVGLVFQDYALWPHMSVREQVAFGMRRGPDMAAGVRRWLELLRIEHLAGRYPHELSGGQKQRVAIARALASEPALLLLDEPFSNLDAPLREALRDELSALYASLGVTVVHVTHDRQEAMGTADRVLIFAGGRLRQDGAPQDVYRDPADSVVATMLGAANLIPGRVESRGAEDVLVAAGLQLIAGRGTVRAGTQGVAFFRPEAARLHKTAPTADVRNVFAAHVHRSGWHDHGWRHRLRVGDGGTEVAVITPVAAAPGAEVWLEVPKEACRILPGEIPA